MSTLSPILSSNTIVAVTIEKGEEELCCHNGILKFISLAASAAPKVSWTFATSYSITLQWETVPCEHRNGDITGYSVKYGVMRSLNNLSETLMLKLV